MRIPDGPGRWVTDTDILSVYLSGMLTGAASVAANSGSTEAEARDMGAFLTGAAKRDPAFRAEVLEGLHAMLDGDEPRRITMGVSYSKGDEL